MRGGGGGGGAMSFECLNRLRLSLPIDQEVATFAKSMSKLTKHFISKLASSSYSYF